MGDEDYMLPKVLEVSLFVQLVRTSMHRERLDITTTDDVKKIPVVPLLVYRLSRRLQQNSSSSLTKKDLRPSIGCSSNQLAED